MLLTIAVSGYRSLRELILPLNVVTGPNGSGKSSLYRSIPLLASAAQGRIIGSLANEGGLRSTLWAGPEAFSRGMKSGDVPVQGTVRRDRVSLKLGFASEDFGYAIDLGLPVPGRSQFNRDPEIKTETVWAAERIRRSNVLEERKGRVVKVIGEKGARDVILSGLPPYDSMMTHATDPRGAPEIPELRERMRSWRFYDHFRTDAEAPAGRDANADASIRWRGRGGGSSDDPVDRRCCRAGFGCCGCVSRRLARYIGERRLVRSGDASAWPAAAVPGWTVI